MNMRKKVVAALDAALAVGGSEAVSALIAAQKIMLNEQDCYGNSLLHMAAAERRSALMHCLMQLDIDATLKNKRGETVLHVLAYGVSAREHIYHETALMARLMRQVGDVNLKDGAGRTPIEVALQQKKISELYVEQLIKAGARVADLDKAVQVFLLQFAVRYMSPESCAVIIRSASSGVIDALGVEGKSALHVAAERKNERVVVTLLVAGALLTVPGDRGESALEALGRCFSRGCVDALLAGVIDEAALIVKKVPFATSALHAAAHLGNCALVRLLVKRGADVNARDGAGKAAWHVAAQCGHKELVYELAALGADTIIKSGECDVLRGGMPVDVEMIRLIAGLKQCIDAVRRQLDRFVDGGLFMSIVDRRMCGAQVSLAEKMIAVLLRRQAVADLVLTADELLVAADDKFIKHVDAFVLKCADARLAFLRKPSADADVCGGGGAGVRRSV